VNRPNETSGWRAPGVCVRPVLGARRARGPGGFTLLEILVTLALIALLSSVLIVGATRLIAEQPALPEDIFRKALGEARKSAVENNTEVRLAYDAKGKVFKASTTEGGVRNYPVTAPGEVTFDFLSTQKGGSTILIGGVAVETQPLPYVTFYPDGTCSSFRVQLRTPNTAQVITIDPWTCAPILESDKDKK
jgi:prepilin-type N-terminal cleavage/methylation domain-containing protein